MAFFSMNQGKIAEPDVNQKESINLGVKALRNWKICLKALSK